MGPAKIYTNNVGVAIVIIIIFVLLLFYCTNIVFFCLSRVHSLTLCDCVTNSMCISFVCVSHHTLPACTLPEMFLGCRIRNCKIFFALIASLTLVLTGFRSDELLPLAIAARLTQLMTCSALSSRNWLIDISWRYATVAHYVVSRWQLGLQCGWQTYQRLNQPH